MASGFATPQPLHVQFKGSDTRGDVTFDVTVDGNGGLSGAYTRQGQSGQVIVANNVLYIRGAAVAASYSGEPVSASTTGWIQMPAWVPTGILGTLATSRRMETCINALRNQVAGYDAQAVIRVGGVITVPYVRQDPTTKWPWEYAIAADGSNHLVAWNFLPPVGQPTLPACNGGAVDTGAPTTGLTGMFTFSGYAQPNPVAAAPAGATPLDTGKAPINDTGPTT